jgi:hypothetical protein
MSENGFSKEIQEVLREKLTVHKRQGGGTTYDYFKGEDILKQLNKAFGHAWSSEVISAEEVHGQILIQASVSVFVEGDSVVHHGFGSAHIAKKRGTEQVIDIGNSYKSAYTGAIKKAAEQFGIGLGGEAPSKTSKSVGFSKGTASAKVPSGPVSSSQYSFTPPPKKEVAAAPPPTGARPPMPKPSGNLKPRSKASAPSSPPPTPAPSTSSTPAKTSTRAGVGGLAFDTEAEELSSLLTDVQKGAIERLTKRKNMTVAKAIEGALSNTEKTLDTLTKAEAALVIRYSNTVKAGA